MEREKLDLVNLLFWLHDAQIGVAGMIKDSNIRQQAKLLFNRMWAATRELKKWVDRATHDIETEKNLPPGIVDESFGGAAEYIVLAVEAKLRADELGRGAELIEILKTYRSA